MRFVGRKEELKRIRKALTTSNGAILIYGKRRIGKTTLIKEVLKDIDAVKVIYTCMPIELSMNASALSSAILNKLGLPYISFNDFQSLFDFLQTRNEKIIIALDEYQDLKKKSDSEYVDAIFRTIIDNSTENISIILSGSSIRIMSELNKSANPLYERFSEVISLKELSYLEASEFYKDCSIREKITYYSIFGGMPILNKSINPEESAKENIIRLFINTDGVAYSYAKSVADIEVESINDAFIILSRIGNGKLRYSEIESLLSNDSSRRQLSRTLKTLADSGLIKKRKPINTDNKKTVFYEIASNSLRFFFSYLLNLEGSLEISSAVFYDHYIKPSINTFISYRFEDIAAAWFATLSKNGKRNDILKIGTYWYNDRKSKKNGEFDVALETTAGFEIYECKFLEDKAPASLVREEKEKAEAIEGLRISRFGIISSSGFKETDNSIIEISGEDLYSDL